MQYLVTKLASNGTTFFTSRWRHSQNIQCNYSLHTRHIREIQKSFKRGRVKVAKKPIHTIGEILPSPKDPLTLQEKSCLVHQAPCFDCSFIYIGQTKLNLKSRLTELKLAIENQEPEKSTLCEHSILFDYYIDWNYSKVFKPETHYAKRLTSEAWLINSPKSGRKHKTA